MKVMKNTALVGLLALGACTEFDSEAALRTDAPRGAMLFAENCAGCHGQGAGGGQVGLLGIVQPAPDLTGLAAANDGVFPRDAVMGVIDGYYRQEHFGDPMPIFGDGDLGPLVQVEEDGLSTPIPADLLALATYLETVQQP